MVVHRVKGVVGVEGVGWESLGEGGVLRRQKEGLCAQEGGEEEGVGGGEGCA